MTERWCCPWCGGLLRFVSGRVWCGQRLCAYDRELPKPERELEAAGF